MDGKKKFKSFFEGEDRRSRALRTGAFTALFLVLNALFAIPFAVIGELKTGSPIGLGLRIAGFTASGLWIAVIVAGRILKRESLLRGLFLYGLAGIASFTFALIAKLTGGENAGGAVQTVFDWFAAAIRPLQQILRPLIGMSEFFAKALVFGILTFLTGIAARSILRERDFQKKMAEKEEFERESEKST